MSATVILAIVLTTIAVTKLKSAAPTLDRGMLTFDTVTVGDMVRDVRGPGTLAPEHVRIIVATTGGRVETLPVTPGQAVHPSTAIVQLSNADVDLAALQVQQQLTQAHAAFAQMKSFQGQQRATQEGTIAQLRTQKRDADRTASVLDSLDRGRMASRNEVAAAHDRALELATRYELEVKRGADMRSADAEQVRFSVEQIDGLGKILASHRGRVASMTVIAGEEGELQSLGNPKLELGQWVNSGIELARVVHAGRLKAVLRVPETQAKDLAPGLPAMIDTRDGVVKGHVASVEPAARGGTVTVEVALDDALPKGARADLGVDGAIEIERLRTVMHVGRPAYAVAERAIRVYRVVPNTGYAVRVDAMLGKGSVTQVEVKSGLARGDSIIISDVSQMLQETRVRLKEAP
ncbi:MAG: HlyD family efflux transporter periplasmic adaptor subunit [Gemmatimonadaceae bacterium]